MTRKSGYMDKGPSLKELEQQAEAGDSAAARDLGDRYRTGDAVQQDWTMALRWYSLAAELGEPTAQTNLGSMFLEGAGCQRDMAQAVYWYRRSAQQGDAIAQWNLGMRCLRGEGTIQDFAEAYECFKKALLNGYTQAACELGTMHRYGLGVDCSLLAAADFHLIAARVGDSEACCNLSEYSLELQNAALGGSQMASVFLCRMHNRGFGVEKSQPLTWAWILCAKKYCESDLDPEIAEEVRESYDFYHWSISSENRKEGQKRLKDMRAAHARQLRKQP